MVVLFCLGVLVVLFLVVESDGVNIDFEGLMIEICEFLKGCGFVLVEGVGGVLFFIIWAYMVIDIVQVVDVWTIVVAVDRLGVIN